MKASQTVDTLIYVVIMLYAAIYHIIINILLITRYICQYGCIDPTVTMHATKHMSYIDLRSNTHNLKSYGNMCTMIGYVLYYGIKTSIGVETFIALSLV